MHKFLPWNGVSCSVEITLKASSSVSNYTKHICFFSFGINFRDVTFAPAFVKNSYNRFESKYSFRIFDTCNVDFGENYGIALFGLYLKHYYGMANTYS